MLLPSFYVRLFMFAEENWVGVSAVLTAASGLQGGVNRRPAYRCKVADYLRIWAALSKLSANGGTLRFLATFGERARGARYWGLCDSFLFCYRIRLAFSSWAGKWIRPKRSSP